MFSLEQLTAIKDKVLTDRVPLREAVKSVIPDFDWTNYRNLTRDLFNNFKDLRKESKIIELQLKVDDLNKKLENLKGPQ